MLHFADACGSVGDTQAWDTHIANSINKSQNLITVHGSDSADVRAKIRNQVIYQILEIQQISDCDSPNTTSDSWTVDSDS
jgi:hypothetical protein